MAKRKILYICHNHPSVRPGGAEVYALELYNAMRGSDLFEPFFLAKGGPPISTMARPHEGTLFGPINGDPNQYFCFTDAYKIDWLYGTITGKDFYTRHLAEFLAAVQPDVVHFQHTLFFGYDLIQAVKNTLPGVAIVYTLHEYLPICHRQGQMVRTNTELCHESSPQRCHECFPEISPQSFFLRKRFIQSHFSQVDLFLAPSRFLQERFVAWGIPAEKIRYEEYGRDHVARVELPEEDRPRNRLGFFGQINAYKGVILLLQAMKLLGDDPTRTTPEGDASAGGNLHLWLHGANLEIQSNGYQKEFKACLESARSHVTMAGRYDQADLPRLMSQVDWVVVPSTWWENSPLVIQEAFQHGRPVICSDIGGMAEKVADGVNGLHFKVGDSASLAQVIRQAVTSPGLWETLRQGIPAIHAMPVHARTLTDIYCKLLERTGSQR